MEHHDNRLLSGTAQSLGCQDAKTTVWTGRIGDGESTEVCEALRILSILHTRAWADVLPAFFAKA